MQVRFQIHNSYYFVCNVFNFLWKFQSISGGTADAVMLDAADVWEAARHYSLEPILSEVYGLGETSYYAVAVTKEQDPDTEITYLKGKNKKISNT